jgi:hypothetical protein
VQKTSLIASKNSSKNKKGAAFLNQSLKEKEKEKPVLVGLYILSKALVSQSQNKMSDHHL